MEEIVALDSSKQKQFVKSIKGIRKLIKKNDTISAVQVKKSHGKIYKKKPKKRGLVYLSHIPHGFYENEMTQYFKQFGVVTNARVIRSKRTGNSKGYAFVEFKETSVGEIVAETMNNYLMGKRLLKAAYIPPEKQRQNALRKRWNPQSNPGKDLRIKMKKQYNEDKDAAGDLKKAKKLLTNISKTKKKLNELGISYAFFTPVDIPDVLDNLSTSIKQEYGDKESDSNKNETKSGKKNKKKSKSILETNDKKKRTTEENLVELKQKIDVKTNQDKKSMRVAEILPEAESAKDKQSQKQQVLKQKGIKPVENFIKNQEGSDDDSSGSSYVFDSDEYEKIMENEDELGGSTDESKDEYDDSDDDNKGGESDDVDEESGGESIEDAPPLKGKGKSVPKSLHLKQIERNDRKQEIQQQSKRKASQQAAVIAKKPKFEKQNKPNPAKKQFNKKKK